MTQIPAETSIGFAALGLAASLVDAVAGLGYEEPTPIQREAIPVLLAGSDVIAQAGTGTGKTAAFALPLLHRLAGAVRQGEALGARALILVPTRELAMQVAEAIHKYAKKTKLTVVPCYGGAPMDQQIRALRRGADIVVATPGRALDHLRRGSLNLDSLEVLVLDEADEMLDMGFAEDLEAILAATPESRQTALFAATMAARIASIAGRHLKKPVRIHVKADKRPAGKLPQIRQSAYVVARAHKGAALGRSLEFETPPSAIVFGRTRIEVDELTDTLKSHGYGAQALHGGMEQKQRDRVMALFRSERADVLVATDVAARGLDIEHVSHVINYDIPTSPEVYVHRIGRTGRVGREGVAITLVEPREQRLLRNIESLTKLKIEIAALPTLAALKAKRLDATRAAVQQRVVAGDLDDMRALVQSLAQDFELLDIAAAAIALLHAEADAESAAGPAVDIPTPAPQRVERARAVERPRAARRAEPRSRVDVVQLELNVGKRNGVRAADIVGAITGEARITSREIGAIRIGDDETRVEVPAILAARIIKSMRGKWIRSKKVEIRTYEP